MTDDTDDTTQMIISTIGTADEDEDDVIEIDASDGQIERIGDEETHEEVVDVEPTADDIIEAFIDVASGNDGDEAQEDVRDVEPTTAEDIESFIADAARVDDGDEAQEEDVLNVEAPVEDIELIDDADGTDDGEVQEEVLDVEPTAEDIEAFIADASHGTDNEIREEVVDVEPTAKDIELFIDDEAQEEDVDVEPTAEDIELFIEAASGNDDGDESQKEVVDVEPIAEDVEQLIDADAGGTDGDDAQEDVIDVEAPVEDIELVDVAGGTDDGETQQEEEVVDVEAPDEDIELVDEDADIDVPEDGDDGAEAIVSVAATAVDNADDEGAFSIRDALDAWGQLLQQAELEKQTGRFRVYDILDRNEGVLSRIDQIAAEEPEKSPEKAAARREGLRQQLSLITEEEAADKAVRRATLFFITEQIRNLLLVAVDTEANVPDIDEKQIEQARAAIDDLVSLLELQDSHQV